MEPQLHCPNCGAPLSPPVPEGILNSSASDLITCSYCGSVFPRSELVTSPAAPPHDDNAGRRPRITTVQINFPRQQPQSPVKIIPKSTLIIWGVCAVLFIIIYTILNAKEKRVNAFVAEVNQQVSRDSAVRYGGTHFNEDLLQPQGYYSNKGLKIKFGKFSFRQQYAHDRHGNEYDYSPMGGRGEMLAATITVTATTDKPSLPLFIAYHFSQGRLCPITTFDVNFSKWQSNSTYTGGSHDNGNDFTKTHTIKFVIGANMEDDFSQSPVYVLASRQGCLIKTKHSYPPVLTYDNDYHSTVCIKDTIFNTKQLSNYTLIKIIDRN